MVVTKVVTAISGQSTGNAVETYTVSVDANDIPSIVSQAYRGGVSGVLPSAAVISQTGENEFTVEHPGVLTLETFQGKPSTRGRNFNVYLNVVGENAQIVGTIPSSGIVSFITNAFLYNSSVLQYTSFEASLSLGAQADTITASGTAAVQCDAMTGSAIIAVPQAPNVTAPASFSTPSGGKVTLQLALATTQTATLQTPSGLLNALNILKPTITDQFAVLGGIYPPPPSQEIFSAGPPDSPAVTNSWIYIAE